MSEFDFIIVGSGPSGALLASRLASSKAAPSILLLEAGGKADDLATRSLATRWISWVVKPNLNWGYKTIPQKHLRDRILDQSRGKAFGGTTNINFCIWTTPPKGDLEEWATRIGDEFFGWLNSKLLMESIEAYYTKQSVSDSARMPGLENYVQIADGSHGNMGKVTAEFSQIVDKGSASFLNAMAAYGWQANPDLNSGDPIGHGLIPSFSQNLKYRLTASAAYLTKPPTNLEIRCLTQVSKVLFEGKRAVGVETTEGHAFHAKKEVIICAGAIDTPKLLMLSGIGPASDLMELEIPVMADLSGVGSNFRDHTLLSFDYEVSSDLVGEPELVTLPPDEKTLSMQDLVNLAVAWVKDPNVEQSSELGSLPEENQRFITRPTVPSYEIACGGNWPKDIPHDKSSMTIKTFCMGVQSTGTVRLQSPNPKDAPLLDPNYLSHPFDRLNTMAQTKTVMDLVANSDLAKHVVGPIAAPKSTSEEDIIDFVESNVSCAWHPVGTAKMGIQGDRNACVDKHFKVLGGVQALRVIDISVCPFMPSTHTTSIAYLVGAWGAERLIAEYSLN